MDSAHNALNKLKSRISVINEDGSIDLVKYNFYNDKFIDAFSNDINTSLMLTVLYDLLKDSDVNGSTKIKLISDFDKVLSLSLFEKDNVDISSDLESYIKSKIDERNNAKKNKDFELADSIRNELLDKGVKLTDTRKGTIYEII